MSSYVYLDYAGAPLVHPDLVDSIANDLKKLVLGNPHSRNSTSVTTTELIDQARFRILNHFSTNVEEYSVVFTNNCTGALKLIGECFDWSKCSKCSANINPSSNQKQLFAYSTNSALSSGSNLVYLQNNHTSVVCMREYAVKNDANVYCITDTQVEEFFEKTENFTDAKCSCNSLFAYPAQSNFCGKKFPLDWINVVHSKNENSNGKKWFVCLDAAGFVANSSLDLSKYRPDFVTLSFYKIFGCPTGVGALLIKNEIGDVLKKRYFGGGTLAAYLPAQNVSKGRKILSERFEDGTLPFQQIVALKHGFQMLEKQGGMKAVNERTFFLAQTAYRCLDQMRHSNGNPVAKIYCHDNFSNKEIQGAIVNFNLLRSDGCFVGYGEAEQMAELYGIQLRTGCFCNQGACQIYLQLSDDQLLANLEAGKECGDVMDLLDGQPLGSVRISFGFMSSINDVKHFAKMIFDCFLEKETSCNFESFWTTVLPVSANGTMVNGSISKEFSHEYALKILSKTDKTKEKIRLTDIVVYPLKSCGGIYATDWEVSKTGLLFDRHWMITNEDGLCLNQKREPKLVLIRPRFDKGFKLLELTFKDCDKYVFKIETNDDKIQNNNYLTTNPVCQTTVCADKVTTSDGGDEVAEWISSILNISNCRLVSQLDSNPRLSKESKKGPLIQNVQVSLANQEQYLLVNRASVRKLLHLIHTTNPEITEDDLVSRFRPNLVIDGAIPFEEDSWKRVTIGNYKFACVGKCTRCQMICINQETAELEPNILIALRNIKENKITFGIYLREEECYETGKISVDDPIEVET